MLERKADERNAMKIACLEDLVPQEHLLRKIEKAVDFNEIYPIVEKYYCEDNSHTVQFIFNSRKRNGMMLY